MKNFTIPAVIWQAVALAQSKEETRYYLNGVYVEHNSITATNGHILIRYELETGLDEGESAIIYVDPTEKGFKQKVSGKLIMKFDADREIVEFFNDKNDEKRLAVCGFTVIEADFPDYHRVIPDHSKSKGVRHIAIQTEYITLFAKADKMLRGSRTANVGFTFGDVARDPMLIHIGGLEHGHNITAVQMPMRSNYE